MKSLALNILDIIQNSIRANADEISLEIMEMVAEDLYLISVKDNGIGIPADMLENVTDPFITSRKTRKIGLGLPLLKYHAELTGGSLTIESEPGDGTEVRAKLSYSHVDRQPMGDIAGVIKILIAANPAINFNYRHTTKIGEYFLSTKEIKEYLEVETLYDNTLLSDIGKMINENLREIEASGFDFKEKILNTI